MTDVDVLIVGGGVAGLSTAYYLSRETDLDLLLLEKEDDIALHASGDNSGMIHHYHPDPEMREKIDEGVRLLIEYQQNTSANFFKPSSSLFLFPKSTGEHLKKDEQPWGDREVVQAEDLPGSLHPDGSERRKIWIKFRQDGLIQPERFLHSLKDDIRRRGGNVQTGCEVRGGSLAGGIWEVSTTGGRYRATRVVNAAGAWADPVGTNFHAAPKKLKPYSRHLFIADEKLLPPELGFYWDDLHDLYFRHHEEGTLLSVCDNHRTEPGEKPDVSDPTGLLRETLFRWYPQFDPIRIKRTWSCQRTRAPERVPCIRSDPDQSGFYWVGGLEGHGITASMWIGKRAANLVQS